MVASARAHVSVTGTEGPRILDGDTAEPTSLGGYRIVERIGAGGMGIVYRATDERLGRDVAIKVLQPALRHARGRERLLGEARALARVSHRGVVAVFAVEADEDQPFIVMELVRGTTLRAWLRARLRGWREVLRVFRSAGAALAAAHAARVLHGDFKPDNVLIDEHGRVRLTDFGVASQLEHGECAALHASSNGRSGTASYMAPEVIDDEPPDVRSDIYSFCVALWEALTGSRPFGGATYAELRAAIAAGVSATDGDLPAWLAGVVVRGLAERRADRHATMAALLAELREPRPPRS